MKDQEKCCRVTVISCSISTILVIALEGVHEQVESWTVYMISIQKPVKALTGVETEKKYWKKSEEQQNNNSQDSKGNVFSSEIFNSSIIIEYTMLPSVTWIQHIMQV